MILSRIGLALTLLLAGECGTAPTDAGPSDAAAGVGRIQIGFEADEQDAPSEWELVSAHVQLSGVRLDNDRGAGFEPSWTRADGTALGAIRLDEDPPSTELAGVPATYGGVALTAETGPTLELVYRVGEARVALTSARAFDIMTRCRQGGVTLLPSGEMNIEVRIDAGQLASVLAETITPPASGTVVVDETEAPETLAAIEAALPDAWITLCEADDDDDG